MIAKWNGWNRLLIVLGVVWVMAGSSGASPGVSEGLLAWYKADEGVYATWNGDTVSGDGDPVGRWEDLSGNGWHQRRSTDAERPTLRQSGSPSGKPELHFDGDDYLLLSTGGSGPSSVYFPAGTRIDTVFVVFRLDESVTPSSTARLLFATSGLTLINSVMFGETTSLFTDEIMTVRDVGWDSWKGGSWRNMASGVTGGNFLADDYHFLCITHTGSSFDIRTRLGGDNLTNVNSGSPDGWSDFNGHSDTNAVPEYLTTFRIGGVIEGTIGRFKGHISEIILYETALDSEARGLVEAYLKEKYQPNRATLLSIR